VSDVTLSIDGKEVTVPQGTLIIRAAEHLGIEIPRFCDHPFLAPAGACRQCFVQIEGQPKLATSCTMSVAPNMVVHTQNTSDEATQAQVANLEFLLLNHPLDCPICDRGGECPLQDQALAFGPGESRFREAKRVYPKPVALSPLVSLDRERCVLCARCTRFCDEISGDRFIELFARSAGERVSIAAGEDFRSPFSGNTIQICPVGALTSTPYRFVARPFDLTSGDSVCNHCSAGCNVRVDVRRDKIVRVLARDNVDVNDAWICDKGRFAFAWPDAPDRITIPLLRGQGLEGASFGEVLTWVAARSAGARVAFLAGGRLMDEDYYALSKLARTVFGTNDLDHRRAPGPVDAERHAAAMPMTVTSKVVERAKTILVVGLDAENEVPILHLRLRKAARNGARISVLHPRRTRLHDVAAHVLAAPGADAALLARAVGEGVSGESTLDAAAAALREAGADGVVLAGERSPEAAELALRLAASTGARFGYVTRRANDRGALRAGVHPALLPGGRPMEQPDDVERVWGPIVNRQPGRDTNAILEACARREVDVLFLLGIDPLRDVPDAALARRALDNVPVTVVQSLELGDLEPFADAFLPAAPSIEKHGHMTDWEGRSQPIHPVRQALGLSRPDWEIFASLALAAGGDLGFETLEELHDEMDRLLAPRPDDTTVPDPTTPTAADGIQLVSYPLLIDDGRLSRDAAEVKAALEDDPFIEIHPEDADAMGLVDGGRAVVRTQAGEAELPVRVTSHIARGVIFVPFNQAGFAANRLLSGSFVTAAQLEAVDRVEEVSA
jgi:NADH-quinone oxidoreductase subunit G